MADQEIKLKLGADGKELTNALNNATKATNNLADSLTEAGSRGAAAGHNIAAPLSDAEQAAKSLKDGIKVAGISLSNLQTAFSRGSDAFQAASGIIAKGLQALGEICAFTFTRLVEGWDSAANNAMKSGKDTADELKRVADAHEKARQNVRGMMDELATLNSTEDKSAVQKQRMIDLVNRLARSYGGLKLSINNITGEIDNFDEAMVKLLEKHFREGDAPNSQSFTVRLRDTGFTQARLYTPERPDECVAVELHSDVDGTALTIPAGAFAGLATIALA